MRKVYKKREEAVSPVIATILMVAITVVLAAVLYVMVIIFGNVPPPTPVGSWNSVDAISGTEGKLVFGGFSDAVSPMDIKLYVYANGTGIGEIHIPTNDITQPQEMDWEGGPIGATAQYYDYNPAGRNINQGDYITLSGLSPRTTYTFEVYHAPTESLVSMTGANGMLSTP